jgi:hypothetical protein
MTTINAFHPDFVKTHMPQFLTAVKTQNMQATVAANLSKSVTEMRKTKPSHGHITGMSTRESVVYQSGRDMGLFPKTRKAKEGWGGARDKSCAMTIDEVRAELTAAQKAKLAPREFHMFSKAGTANTTKTKK